MVLVLDSTGWEPWPVDEGSHKQQDSVWGHIGIDSACQKSSAWNLWNICTSEIVYNSLSYLQGRYQQASQGRLKNMHLRYVENSKFSTRCTKLFERESVLVIDTQDNKIQIVT